uniref:Fe2OG dioxygenase domain-containing protein n=1 Tax=Chaetoceros debilis TaxID=122233 RepID=A0A7S3PXY7_9STRA
MASKRSGKKNEGRKERPKAEGRKSVDDAGSEREGGNKPIGTLHLLFSVLALLAGIITPPLLRSNSILEGFDQLKSIFVGYAEKDISLPHQSVTKEHKRDLGSSANKNIEADSYIERDLESGMEENLQSSILHVECSSVNAAMFVHEEAVPGMHIICLDEHGSFLKVWKSARPTAIEEKLQGSDFFSSFVEFIKDGLLVREHHLSNTQPWAIFSTNGERLSGELDFTDEAYDDLKMHGMVILMEGGNWIWPGVRIGFKRNIDLFTGYSTISDGTPERNTAEIETLSLKPLVLSVKNFITERECDHIQDIALPRMEYSSVTLMDKDAGRPASDFRTSQSAFVGSDDDEIMEALEIRTASLTRVPKNHQEYTQVLRYGYSEKYSGHVDYFDPNLYQNDANTLNLIQNGKKNRLSTVFWYLSDVKEGGETNFPRYGAAPQPWDLDKCGEGLMVKPEKGKVIVFYSLKPNGEGDELSLHAACPVKDGVKWAANKWVWNSPMGFVS